MFLCATGGGEGEGEGEGEADAAPEGGGWVERLCVSPPAEDGAGEERGGAGVEGEVPLLRVRRAGDHKRQLAHRRLLLMVPKGGTC